MEGSARANVCLALVAEVADAMRNVEQ